MLEEIVGMILSVFSLFVNEVPRLFRQEQPHQTGELGESQPIEEDIWPPYINKEYESCNNEEMISSSPEFIRQRLTGYDRLDDVSSDLVSYRESICKSFWTSLSVTIAIVPLTVFTIAFLYFHLNTTNLCIEWQYHDHTLPLSVKRLQVIGESVEAIILNLWFPLTTVVLFSWKVFKTSFISTLYVGVIFGLVVIIYFLFLLVFGIYGTHVYYITPANALALTGVTICGTKILRNIRASEQTVSYSNFHILALVLSEQLLCYLLSFVTRYGSIPLFKSVKEQHYKFLIAAMAPALAIIPAAILKHIALRRSSEVVHPGRSFVLAYCLRGGVIYRYRTMQADFKNIWLFVGLSLFSGVFKMKFKCHLLECYGVEY